jgi:hypothetical protein
MKTSNKLSNQLARNFRLFRKQEGNGSASLSSHWLAVGQSQSHGATVSESVSPSWSRAHDQTLVTVKTVMVLSMWGTLSDEKRDLSLVRVTVSSNK